MGYAILDPRKIEEAAEEHGLRDRAALAEAAGISMDTLRRIEREERVTFYTSRKVARALDLEPGSFWHPEHRPLDQLARSRAHQRPERREHDGDS